MNLRICRRIDLLDRRLHHMHEDCAGNVHVVGSSNQSSCPVRIPVLSSIPSPSFHPHGCGPHNRIRFFSVVGSPRFCRVTRPGQFSTRPVHCFPFVWWWHTTTPRPFGTTSRQQGLNPKHWVQDTSKMESTYDKWFQMADQVRARTLREGT